jgi:hypothetical protein
MTCIVTVPPCLQGHTSCVTEVQKYAEGATKPGGFAAQGYVGEKQPECSDEVAGGEFLTKSAPWRCTICKVDCTSEATLLSHATGQKHKRRCRAAAAANGAAVEANTPVAKACSWRCKFRLLCFRDTH